MPVVTHPDPAERAARDATIRRFKAGCSDCPQCSGGQRPTCRLARGRCCYELARADACPAFRFPGQQRPLLASSPAALPAPPRPAGPWDNGKGAARWGELHRWALAAPAEGDGRPWLESFVGSLATCGGCQRDFRAWAESDPCPWGAGAWEWSVRAHNAVNRKLGRAEWGLEQARRRWVDFPATFRRVVVINLARRPDRWAEFNAGLPPDWPFTVRPERFDAIDAHKPALPGGDVEGCMQSHRGVLDAAVRDGVDSILVMEDDCILHPRFGEEVAKFIAAVPDDWRGLWIGNQPAWWAPDGKGSPQTVVPGRVARTRWPHRMHCYGLRGEAIRAVRDFLLNSSGHADHAVGEFVGSRFPVYFPHPHALAGQRRGFSNLMNRVMEEQWWGIPPAREPVASPKRTVFLPFYGEFGILILHHVRMVHSHPAAEKIVCCERGQECLYPTATGFFYDWKNPVPDALRSGNCELGTTRSGDAADARLRPKLAADFPGAEVVRLRYDTFVDLEKVLRVKFAPVARRHLPQVDVAVVARKRDWAPERNFAHWPEVIGLLRAGGLKVGILGARDTSFGVEADAYAWEHPDGPTAGCVDLLSQCRLHLGTDTGVSHLAAMLDVPMVIFRDYREEHGWGMTHFMQKVSTGYFRRLPNSAWTRPGEVLEGVATGLRESIKPLRVREFHSQHGEDRWLWENRDLPTVGVFVEVGMGDGKKNSNTLAMEEAGWRGILVEPDPRRHNEIRARRKSRLYACAAGPAAGWAEFGMENDADLSGLLRPGARKIEVEVRPLGAMLEQAGIEIIDLLSIDTEGTELDVWQSFNVRRHRPRFVIIEWNTVGMPGRKEEIARTLAADGYRVIHETEGNLILEPDAVR